jgi:hypothetical protein
MRKGDLMRTMRVLFLLAVTAGGLQAAAGGAELIFPQVARGSPGNYIETAIVILNPQPDPVTVELDSFGIDLPETTILVKAGATREIRFSGPEFQVGWVRLRSDRFVSATARILTRKEAASDELLSQLSVPAQPLSSKFVAPVFFRTSHTDDTGIALAVAASGRLRLTLVDERGETVAVRNFSVSKPGSEPGAELTGHFAAFLSEIFDLPPDFAGGSLTIELVLPEGLPGGLSAMAVYTSGAALHASPVAAIDRPGTYSVVLREASEPGAVMEELAAQYGVFPDGILERPDVFAVTMTEEAARAVSRDPRVLRVDPAENAGRRHRFEFENGMEDWSVGFAGFPADDDPGDYELHFEHTNLPDYLGGDEAILVRGTSVNPGLLMFAKRRIEGLEPLSTYNVRFEAEIATQAPRDAAGPGGSPGESVQVVAGASLVEPRIIVGSNGWFAIDVLDEGREALVLGNIAKRSSVFSERFELKTLDSLGQPFLIETDESGSLWLLIGTSSGWHGRTVLYYNRISVAFYER